MTECALCLTDGGTLLWQNAQLRVIDAGDPLYPAFTRVVWKHHVAEMTDLSTAEQHALMRVVFLVEKIQRDTLQPDKINLAAFGNMVPHLHWHIIARWRDDMHFPQPVWAQAPVATAASKKAYDSRRENISGRMAIYHQALIDALEQQSDTDTLSMIK